MALTQSEIHAVEVAEKVSSLFSVVGAIFIIFTFVFDGRFRKPINRLVFYAAWGNLFANVATLISRSGIRVGITSPLCQFQGFLIQWFMPADALWTLAMACNVYLTFFRQYDGDALRKLEWKYLTLCYGVPFIPAFTYCFLRSSERGRVYGSANLWCWVTPKWNALRIATFYGPVWIVILTIMVIYIKVGTLVFKWRRHLLTMDIKVERPTSVLPASNFRSSFRSSTYGVSITSQVPHSPDVNRHLSFQKDDYRNSAATLSKDGLLPVGDNLFLAPGMANTVVHCPIPQTLDANKATISYCNTALLFFLALLCTWVPSTVNRVYTLATPHPSPFALDFASALVLPLQGFWNTIIYIVTSLPACQALWQDIKFCFVGDSSTQLQEVFVKERGQSFGSSDTSADITICVEDEGKETVIHHKRSRSLSSHSTQQVADVKSDSGS